GQVPEVRYERDATRNARDTRESQSAAHDRAQTVCANDQRCPHLSRGAVRIQNGHPAGAAAAVADHVGYSCTLHERRARRLSLLYEDRIEYRSPHRDSAIVERAVSVVCDEASVYLVAVRRADAHACQLCR